MIFIWTDGKVLVIDLFFAGKGTLSVPERKKTYNKSSSIHRRGEEVLVELALKNFPAMRHNNYVDEKNHIILVKIKVIEIFSNMLAFAK